MFPGVPEVCDGKDNDCDGITPEGFDEPGLGTGCDGIDSDLCIEGVLECTAGTFACNDNTGNDIEVCDNIDNDCDSLTDEGFMFLGDSCGFGNCAGGVIVCSVDQTGTVCSTDSQSSAEICHGLDNDCDGSIDDGGVCGECQSAGDCGPNQSCN